MAESRSSLEDFRWAHTVAKAIQAEVPRRGRPPDEGTLPETEQVLPHSIFRDTREYIEKIVFQINGTYERGWFDGCAVMIRRLVETLIIEAFERHKIEAKIKNAQGDFVYLNDLVTATLNETTWNLGRNAKRGLKELKDVGDKSAHSRRFNAHVWDIDTIRSSLRDVAQELLTIAELRRKPRQPATPQAKEAR